MMNDRAKEETDKAESLPIPAGTRSWRERIRAWLPKRRSNRWLLLIFILLAVAAAWEVWNYYSIRQSTDDAKINGNIIPVSARIKGTVVAVNVVDNQYVEAGTILAQLDTSDYEVALAQTRADLAAMQASAEAARTGVPVESVTSSSRLNTARATMQQAQGGVEAAQKEVESATAAQASAQARVREAEANYTKAEQDLDRYKKLIVKDEISQQQYDSAVATAQAAKAVRDAARAVVAETEKSVGAAEARLEQAKSVVSEAQAGVQAARTAPQNVAISRSQAAAADAKVAQARAAVDQAQLNLQYTAVKAPVSGIVSNKSVELGQVIQSGQALLAVVPLEGLWVRANFKETQLENIRPGQPAYVSVDALGGRTFKGHVESIGGATAESFSLLPPENASGNFVKVVQRIPVRIAIEKDQDPDHRMRVGMSVEVTIITN